MQKVTYEFDVEGHTVVTPIKETNGVADNITESLYQPRRGVSKNVEYFFMKVEGEINRRLKEQP